MMIFDISEPVLFRTTHEAAYPIIMLVNSLLYYYWCAIATTAYDEDIFSSCLRHFTVSPRLCLALWK
jgi:hypothetical protein